VNQVLQRRRSPRTGAPWFVYPLALALVVGPAGWWGWKAWRASEAEARRVAARPVETSICEQLLAEVSRDNPERFYICASTKTTIVKVKDGVSETQPLLANAVYELPLDRATRVQGLGTGVMRYGWNGHYCSGLRAALRDRPVLLSSAPVDEDSC